MVLITVASGIAIGLAAGAYSGYDIGHSVSLVSAGRPGGKVMVGILRRSVVILAGLFGGLAIGRWALVGVVVGIICGFAGAVVMQVRKSGS